MNQKKYIKSNVWTSFWKAVGVHPEKRQRLLSHPEEVEKRAVKPLIRVGVEKDVVKKVLDFLSRYSDPLVFYNLSRFFRIDPITVQQWTSTDSTSEAFVKIFRIFQRNPLSILRKRFRELYYLHEYNRKGEGWHFQAKYAGKGSVYGISLSRFTRLLNRSDPRLRYCGECKFRIDNEVYICVDRLQGNRRIHKFIVIRKVNNDLQFRISADSAKEVRIIKAALRNEFGVLIDSPQISCNFNKLTDFLRSGASRHFTLTGITLFHDQFQVSIFPKYGVPFNVAEYKPYKDRLRSVSSPKKSLVRFRLLHRSSQRRTQVLVDVRNYQTSGVIGAVLLDLDDKGLNKEEKQIIRQDFKTDFIVPLDTFIGVRDLVPEEIYEKLLQTKLRKSVELDLRSSSALRIYRGLVEQGLFDWPIEKKYQPRYCVSRLCARRYRTVSKGKHCSGCGELLLPGKVVVIDKINERRICQFVSSVLVSWNIKHQLLQRKVLGRDIFVIEVRTGDDDLEIIPIAKPLNDNQIILLRLRYQNQLVLSSREDLDSLSDSNITCKSLANFICKLDYGTKKEFLGLHSDNAKTYQDRIQREAKESRKRLADNRAYSSKEKQTKNLGAELFEADCHVLLHYMFGNSIWLGARTRASAFPDGMTAFPITGHRNGCFLWDAKFGKRGKVRLGKDDKNLHYIRNGRKNHTIKDNGYLKALVFMSNGAGPKYFERKYSKLLADNKIGNFRVLFMNSKLLISIYDHFRKHERDIVNNQQIQRIFVDSLRDLLYKIKEGQKAHIVAQSEVDAMLKANEDLYRSGGTKRLRAKR